jgi:hypothetical protein
MNTEEERNHECFQMHTKARLLGFPDKVDLANTSFAYQRIEFNAPLFAKLKNPVYYYIHAASLADDLLSLRHDFFSNEQFDYAFTYKSCFLSRDIVILLVLMNLFYKKDWDGKDWVSIPERPQREWDWVDVATSSAAKQMTKTIDKEILDTIKLYFDDNAL